MLTAARTTPVHPGAVVPAAVLPPGCRHQYSGRNSRGSGLFTHLSPRSSYPEGPGANHAEDSRLCIAAAYAVVLSSYCSICVFEVVQRWAICVHEDNQGISVSRVGQGLLSPRLCDYHNPNTCRGRLFAASLGGLHCFSILGEPFPVLWRSHGGQ